MSFESVLSEYWGIAGVLALFVLWWVIRPIWNALAQGSKILFKYANKFVFGPLLRFLAWILRFLLRWLFRLAPVGVGLWGFAAALTAIVGDPITALPNAILNGFILALGLGLFTPIAWTYYKRHSGSGFVSLWTPGRQYDLDAEPDMDLSLDA